MIQAPTGTVAKAHGAYYTEPDVASFLVRFAVRHAQDRVLDPALGGGVFLAAAGKRLVALGGDPGRSVFGAELDGAVVARVRERLGWLLPAHVSVGDFFERRATDHPLVDAVVGNPPFIRYQRFSGMNRQRALARAAEQGVKLSSLASSWAPFIVHAAACVRHGGRLAMVAPAELGHARYARPVLEFLLQRFTSVTLVTFEKALFSDLSQDTVLLLCDGAVPPRARDESHHAGSLSLVDLRDAKDLREQSVLDIASRSRIIDARALVNGRERLHWQVAQRAGVELYRELSRTSTRLGSIAAINIGYVTGANAFFHMSPAEIQESGLDLADVKKAAYRARAFAGLAYNDAAHERAAAQGHAGFLFLPRAGGVEADTAVGRMIRKGEQAGAAASYKARSREPWFRVPGVIQPDLFLTYMSGGAAGTAINEVGAVAPNTLLTLQLAERGRVASARVAIALQTSLARLSFELEGHWMGGGLLKTEPSEARNLALALPAAEVTAQALAAINVAMRKGAASEVVEIADAACLGPIGLTCKEIDLLRRTASELATRRQGRGRP